jgi:hypothetical protein
VVGADGLLFWASASPRQQRQLLTQNKGVSSQPQRQFSAFVILHPVSFGIGYPAGIRHPASGIRHPASGIRHSYCSW